MNSIHISKHHTYTGRVLPIYTSVRSHREGTPYIYQCALTPGGYSLYIPVCAHTGRVLPIYTSVVLAWCFWPPLTYLPNSIVMTLVSVWYDPICMFLGYFWPLTFVGIWSFLPLFSKLIDFFGIIFWPRADHQNIGCPHKMYAIKHAL